ncbi:MAG: ComF family protein [Weeksellaceae bacterium]|nr:ComF family protein [Weeksellaceae bacterium]
MEIKTILNSLVDLFFPMRCVHCSDVIQSSQYLCVSCVGNLSFTHWQFDQNNKAFKQLYQYCNVEECYSLLHFNKQNPTQSLLHELKYNNRPEIGQELARLLQLDLSKYDGIIPVPIHQKRLKQRGYNQVDGFAKELAQINHIRFVDNVLKRVHFNSSQVLKNKQERLKDMESAFELVDKSIKGHYIIIDDLLTTGATLSQAVKSFNGITDVKISVITIACA